MKNTLTGICLAASLLASTGAALAQGADPDAQAPASRWSSSVMDRHMPLDAARLQQLSQRKFRYMDMASVKPSKAIRNAVMRYGAQIKQTPGKQQQPDSAAPAGGAAAAEPVVVLRPMT